MERKDKYRVFDDDFEDVGMHNKSDNISPEFWGKIKKASGNQDKENDLPRNHSGQPRQKKLNTMNNFKSSSLVNTVRQKNYSSDPDISNLKEENIKNYRDGSLESVREFINEDHYDKIRTNRIFSLFVAMNVFLNFDTGVIPAALIAIDEELHINQEQIAYLGSIVYLGLSFSTLFAPNLFRLISAKWLIIIMVMLNSAA